MLELYRAIWQMTGRRQTVLIVISAAVAALAAVPLEFQKNIVNALTEGDVAARQLLLLGAGMMTAILLSLGLKFLMGYLASTLGEDTIRRLRRRLLDRAEEDRATEERKGTLATAISAEAEELGKFVGSAFSQPVMQLGTLISVVGYISTTQPRLGLIALAMILPQIAIVVISQRMVNVFVSERVKILRQSNDCLTEARVAEVEDEVRAHFDEIYETRRRMFLCKLSAKFMLSAINGIGTVAVLMLGGWLVLNGRTDVGTVVAATTGLTRIQGPTGFLIAFYRQVSATRIKFELLREVFGAVPKRPDR
ncbi:ABC transporter transmembrane region [Cribrihabitans marinus]|uniref:ABC transporter transmembrane region n=1 Tax=Cribrihabitans marinus TaxID=1227549 RepID=A0A1H6T9Q1_9RHOB|nr:ABC transporter transmembrane domain-containing protein [Cribrihabitans marinus]GGH22514.1 hypothetical protein GCM10010973_07860 [Cribrihabitans marinus]SEI73817.1 ABC transporter transmembrane region [Cribrihabitans marinus]